MRLASRFGRINQIRRDRPLTHEELMSHVPSVFGALEAIVRQAKQDRSEPQQMREFVANGGSLIGLVQKHCEIWTA